MRGRNNATAPGARSIASGAFGVYQSRLEQTRAARRRRTPVAEFFRHGPPDRRGNAFTRSEFVDVAISLLTGLIRDFYIVLGEPIAQRLIAAHVARQIPRTSNSVPPSDIALTSLS